MISPKTGCAISLALLSLIFGWLLSAVHNEMNTLQEQRKESPNAND